MRQPKNDKLAELGQGGQAAKQMCLLKVIGGFGEKLQGEGPGKTLKLISRI